jgi:hypothetical protein
MLKTGQNNYHTNHRVVPKDTSESMNQEIIDHINGQTLRKSDS